MLRVTTDEAIDSKMKIALASLALGIMRPLARFLLRNGMSCHEYTEICRWAFVDAAGQHEEFRLKGRRPSKSRISVITGLSRKEVQRLMSIRSPEITGGRETTNRAARVIAGWMEDRAYNPEGNAPRVLPLQGGVPSFADLVRRYSGDVPYRAVLDELLNAKNVRLVESNQVELINTCYMPVTSSVDSVKMMAESVSDMVATMEHNFRPGIRTPFPQRQWASQNIPAHVKPYLLNTAVKEISTFTESLQKEVQKVSHETRQPGVEYCRAGIGLYYFENDQ